MQAVQHGQISPRSAQRTALQLTLSLVTSFLQRLIHPLRKTFLRWNELRDWQKFRPGDLAPGAIFPNLPAAESADPTMRGAIVDEATNILLGKFTGLGGREMRVHTPPIWYRDYVIGNEAPTTSIASDLSAAKLPRGMDLRVVWEINRWSHLARLAQAFYLTRDEHFRETVCAWLNDWHAKNSIGRGWNWLSRREASIRLINLCWIDTLCRLPDELTAKLLPAHVWWIARHRTEPENALLCLSSLICAAARWPQSLDWSSTQTSLEVAWQNEVLNSFSNDGGGAETSLQRHHFHLEAACMARLALLSRGQEIPPPVSDALAHGLHWFSTLADAEEPWGFGDREENHIFPSALTEESVVREWLSWLNGESSGALTYWFGEAPKPLNSLVPNDFQRFMGDGWKLLWHQRQRSGPDAHEDALHCSLWKESQAVMIDPGHGLRAANYHNGPHPADPKQRGTAPTRRIESITKGWRFTDTAGMAFRVYWQLAPQWEIEPHGDEFILFRDGQSLQLKITGASVSLTEQKCYPSYGKSVASPTFKCTAEGGQTIITEISEYRLL